MNKTLPLVLCCLLAFFARAQTPLSTQNMEMVGALPLSRVNADVWGHGNFAYVGTWTSGCPGTGVKIVDITNPAAPRQVAVAAAFANTSAEDVVVRSVETPFFRGDLLAAGIQICSSLAAGGRRGVSLFDVTTPAAPRELGFFDTTAESGGVHEMDLLVRGARVFALLATIARFRIVEVTDPRNPVQIADWHLTERLGEPLTGAPPLNNKFVHSARASDDGGMVVLSYWDAGAILLDISDPSSPRFLGRTGFAAGEKGNTHSAVISSDRRLLLTADEDSPCFAAALPAGNDFTFLRVFDISDPLRPNQISIFQTENSRVLGKTGPFPEGCYGIHNPTMAGPIAFLSWYGDGIRAVDLSNPLRPREVGSFVGREAVNGIWGVHVMPERDQLVLASDMQFGLYLMRPLRPEGNAGGILDGASFLTSGGAGTPVAPGAIVSLFGRDLAGATASAEAQPLPTRLAGSSVLVNGRAAPLFYVSPLQINFQMPPDTPAGSVTIRLDNAGRLGAAVAITTVASAPGIFTRSQDGRGPAAALRASDQSAITAARPIREGDTAEFFLSGVNGAAPVFTIGGQRAELLFIGPAPGFTGLWQANVRVPAGVRGSPEVRAAVGTVSSNAVTLAVE